MGFIGVLTKDERFVKSGISDADHKDLLSKIYYATGMCQAIELEYKHYLEHHWREEHKRWLEGSKELQQKECYSVEPPETTSLLEVLEDDNYWAVPKNTEGKEFFDTNGKIMPSFRGHLCALLAERVKEDFRKRTAAYGYELQNQTRSAFDRWTKTKEDAEKNFTLNREGMSAEFVNVSTPKTMILKIPEGVEIQNTFNQTKSENARYWILCLDKSSDERIILKKATGAHDQKGDATEIKRDYIALGGGEEVTVVDGSELSPEELEDFMKSFYVGEKPLASFCTDTRKSSQVAGCPSSVSFFANEESLSDDEYLSLNGPHRIS